MNTEKIHKQSTTPYTVLKFLSGFPLWTVVGLVIVLVSTITIMVTFYSLRRDSSHSIQELNSELRESNSIQDGLENPFSLDLGPDYNSTATIELENFNINYASVSRENVQKWEDILL